MADTVFTYPCHPRDIRTLRGGTLSNYVVPQGKIFVLTALGAQRQLGVAPSGLIAPLADLYANGALVVRGGTLGYLSSPGLALRELYGPLMAWAQVPPGISFPAGTLLQVRRPLQNWQPPHEADITGRAAGYLVSA